jgi:hypothetical protein
MGGSVFVELQGTRQRVEDLLGGVLVTPLLQAHVVVAADAGEHRDLLAAQSAHSATAAEVRHADVRRVDQFTPGAEVLADQVLVGH